MSRTEEYTPRYDGVAWLLQRLPPAAQYIELVGDAPAVAVAREPRGVDTINDPSDATRTFFKAVRDHESELVDRLADTDPQRILETVSRATTFDPEHDLLDDDISDGDLSLNDTGSTGDLVDRAAAVFVRAGGLDPVRQLAETPGRWTFHAEEKGSLSRPTDNADLLLRIHDVVDRLRRIQIEHEPLDDVIDRHDDDDALFFAVLPVGFGDTPAASGLVDAIQDLEGDVALVTTDWEPTGLTSAGGWSSERVPEAATTPFSDEVSTLHCNFEIESHEVRFEPYSVDGRGVNTEQVGIGHFAEGDEDCSMVPSPPGGSVSIRGGKLLPFRWYGGKYSHLNWLLPLLDECETFVEPFGGSGAVLLNQGPSTNEVYNDIDEEVVSFLRTLKGDVNGDAAESAHERKKMRLIRSIALTPFSRGELAEAVARYRADSVQDPRERARQFFIRAGQTRSGLAQEASAGRWAYCKGTSRRTMSGALSRWHGRLKHLYSVSDRLQNITIENRDALDVIKEYGDDADTLIYCDPPYPHDTRGDTNSYGYELDDDEHRALAEVLNNCEAKVALSSYESPLYDELYSDDAWEKHSEEQTMHTTKDSREEILLMNYEPPTQG